MQVRSVELKNYRNYGSLQLDLSPGTNLFFGDNAQGKTNLLEAIYACATTSSHRSSKDREIIAFGEEEAHVRLFVEKRGVTTRLDYHISRSKGKEAAVGGVALSRVSELLGQLHVVFFSPEDLKIIKSAPVERRTFLNVELCQLSPLYTRFLVEYKRTLMQRNALLKEVREKPDLRKLLDIYDEKLAEAGEQLMKERRAFLEELAGIAAPIHREITEGKEDLKISYEPGAEEGKMAENLFLTRDRDLAAGSTGSGPHRDEIDFAIDGVSVKHFGSQGQQRTTALSLKLAEIELVKRKIGEAPVLLLDDVLSELDEKRQDKLLKSIKDIQTLLTCTGMDDFVERRVDVDKKWRVAGGSLTEVEKE